MAIVDFLAELNNLASRAERDCNTDLSTIAQM
jgi:hypothetical protein